MTLANGWSDLADLCLHRSLCHTWNIEIDHVSILLWSPYSTPCLKNIPPLACYNFDTWTDFDIFFVRNVTAKVSHLYSTGQTSCWASAHILVPTMFMLHKRKVFKVTLRFLPWCHCSSLAVTNVDYCTDYSAEKWMKSVWPLILLKTLKWVCSFCYGRPME